MSHKPQPHLLLHNIIGAMSYWGTTVRILLAGFVFGVAVLLHITEANSLGATSMYLQAYLYVMACLLLLDAGYVTIARGVPSRHPKTDRFMLWIALIVLSVIAIAPYFVEVNAALFETINVWLFAVVLFLLSLRLAIGMVSSSK